MTLTEALGEGLAVTAIGLIIVFSVLIILMVVLMLMKSIFYKEPDKAAKTVKTDVAEIKPKLIPVAEETQGEEIDDGELVAVLTAAIAASLNTSTYNLRIKSYKRVSNTAPAWNKAGLNDVINSRY